MIGEGEWDPVITDLISLSQTTYFSFPFYDRMADMQGFVIKYLAQYHLKPGPCALTTFLVQLVPKNEKGKVEKAEKVKSARRRSSGREVDQW